MVFLNNFKKNWRNCFKISQCIQISVWTANFEGKKWISSQHRFLSQFKSFELCFFTDILICILLLDAKIKIWVFWWLLHGRAARSLILFRSDHCQKQNGIHKGCCKKTWCFKFYNFSIRKMIDIHLIVKEM